MKMDKYEKFTKGLDLSGMPNVARPVMIALGQLQCGEPIDQVCPRCGAIITVEAKTLKNESRPCAWLTACKCGACNSSFRGL